MTHWYDEVDLFAYRKWVRSRPKIVRDTIREFPHGTHIDVYGEDWVVFGATEDGWLIVVPYAAETYEEAAEQRRHICAECKRAGRVHVLEES